MNKSFTIRSLLVITAAVGIIEGSAAAACWYPDEIVADQVKDFQYMLMVGALQCRNTAGPSNEAYNAFVNHQRGVLDSNGYVLKGHFLRENGVQSGRAAYDEYSTALSNRHAGRGDQPSFCQTIATYTRLATTVADHDFILLAEAVIEPPATSCTAPGVAATVAVAPRRIERVPALDVASEGEAADPYNGVLVAVEAPAMDAPEAMPAVAYAPPREALLSREALPAREAVPPPATVPAVAYAAPLPPVAPALVAQARLEPAPAVKAALIPTTVIAAAPVVPPQEARAAPSATDALQAAITALQAATDALKAQQAHPAT